MYNERAQMLIETLDQSKDNIRMWNEYSDGRREGIKEAIQLIKIAFELEEKEVQHA